MYSYSYSYIHTLWKRERVPTGWQDGDVGSVWERGVRGRGGGGPTRLCPGERTNGLVSLPRGSSAGPSSTWVINICDRGDSWPRSGLKTQRQLRLVMALSGRRPVITCGLSSRADDTPSDTE